MRETFVAALEELCARDPRVILLTGDLGFGVLDGFRRRFPERFVNAGVAEQNMTALAAGLALEGRIAFTYSIANFPTLRCLEFLRNDVCGHGADVKVVAVGAGFSYGTLGSSHYALEDLGVLRTLAGLTIFSPGDAWEAEQATHAAAATPGPVYLRLDKTPAARTPAAEARFVPGAMRCLRRGAGITLIATGGILGEVLAASAGLAAAGIGARVLSAHTLAPFDAAAVAAASRETGGIVTVEEHVAPGGLGSAVAEALADAGAGPRRFLRITARSPGAAVGDQAYLRERQGLSGGAIAARVRALCAAPPREQEAAWRQDAFAM